MLGRVFARSRLIEANALFAIFYGLGAFLGPTLGGLLMDLAPPHGLAYFIAALALMGGIAILLSKLPARVELIVKNHSEKPKLECQSRGVRQRCAPLRPARSDADKALGKEAAKAPCKTALKPPSSNP